MKANELRIGNYLQDFGGNIAQVIHLTKDKTILESPIPLTEELLIKCGFEKITNANRYGYYIEIANNRFICWQWADEVGIENFDGDEMYPCCITCKYVHQLQNLYYALTGNELEVKP